MHFYEVLSINTRRGPPLLLDIGGTTWGWGRVGPLFFPCAQFCVLFSKTAPPPIPLANIQGDQINMAVFSGTF